VLYDPALWQHHELSSITSPYDLDVHRAAHPSQARPELRFLIACVGVEFEQERIHPEKRRHQRHATAAVLDVGRVDDGLHCKALRVDEDMPLLAFDLLAAIEAWRINPAPPF